MSVLRQTLNATTNPTELGRIAALTAFYLAMAWFVLVFFGGNRVVLFVWLAFGPATATVYAFGYRMLIGVFLGGLLGFLLSGDLAEALNGALRHTLVLGAGAWLLRHEQKFDPALESLGDYQRIFAIACAQGFLAATLTEILAWLSAVPGHFSFAQFFAGSMLGVLVGVPAFLVWRNPPRDWVTRENFSAVLLIIGLSWFVGQVVFLDWMKESLGQIARGYWMFLLITWSAVRLGPHGAVLVVVMTAIQALVGAQAGTGFFSNDIVKTHLANYYYYMLCLSGVGMALATYFAQRRRAMCELDAKVTELDRLNVELARKNEEMEGMIYTASHDLRSPLVNIQGFSQRMEKSIGDLQQRLSADDVPQTVRDDLARVLKERIPAAIGFIRSSSIKMDMLINGLLRLSRAGRVQLNIQLLDMDAMLHEIAANLTIQIQQAGATLELGPLPHCRGDATQINQVFTNLIDNAIKYRDPTRPLTIRVSGVSDGRTVRFEVSDNGIGIATDFQPKVWQLFHRLDPNGPIAGEGLGLTLVRRIIERHNGCIGLDSQPGVGSRFTIELPAAS